MIPGSRSLFLLAALLLAVPFCGHGGEMPAEPERAVPAAVQAPSLDRVEAAELSRADLAQRGGNPTPEENLAITGAAIVLVILVAVF